MTLERFVTTKIHESTIGVSQDRRAETYKVIASTGLRPQLLTFYRESSTQNLHFKVHTLMNV